MQSRENETSAFFNARRRATEESGQKPQWSGAHWEANANFRGHPTHYVTYGIQARAGSEAYERFAAVGAVLSQFGIRAMNPHMTHGSIVSTRMELHAPSGRTERVLLNKTKNGIADDQWLQLVAETEKQVEEFFARAEPFDLQLRGPTLMPQTISYEVVDTKPYNQFVGRLWSAVPNLSLLGLRPIDPNIPPLDGGAIALFQAAYDTHRYPLKWIEAAIMRARRQGLDEPVTLHVDRIHRLQHSLSSDRVARDGAVSVPSLTSNGTFFTGKPVDSLEPTRPTHWVGMPTKIIELGGRSVSDLAR